MADSRKSTEQIYFSGMEPEKLGRSVAARKFEPLILREYLEKNDQRLVASVDIAARDQAHQAFLEWFELLKKPSFRNQTESNLEQAFNQKCLMALGYKDVSQFRSDSPFTLAVKQPLPGGKEADVVLGRFPDPEQVAPNIRVVVELKGPSVKLDRPSGRDRSPVDQAFGYLSALDTPNLWAIVTNMVEFRLYHKSRSNVRALVFRLPELSDIKVFGQFYAAFRAENLLPLPSDAGYSKYATLAMLEESEQRQQKVGSELYKHYRDNRIRLIEAIRQDQLCASFDDALSAAQLLLDRMLFIAFAEDRDLLNQKRIIERTAGNREVGIGPWKAFQYLFAAINEGDPDNNVPGYNGSLFKPHSILDHPSFRLPRDPWMEVFRTIGGFDYSDQVNVTVLGHIFEQSITDIEKLRSTSQQPTEAAQPAESETKPKGKTKTDSARKKHGVYYTDDSVTEYLVAAALDPVWAEADARTIAAFPDADTPAAIRARIAALDSLTLCDPACGSGAFLVAALKWFVRKRHELLETLQDVEPDAPEWQPVQRANEAKPFTDDERTPAIVLKNNLYGVDLSAESVEITRLALWLQTATEGQKLTDLSQHIRQGNSVVDDPDALPEGQKHHAFEWRSAFPEVFARGGFDVVVGNPPYVRQERISQLKPHFENRFPEVYDGIADLYVYFFARGLEILRPHGRMAYICSNGFARAAFGTKLRRWVQESNRLIEYVDLGDTRVFEDAKDVTPALIVIERAKPKSDDILNYFALRKGDNYREAGVLKASRSSKIRLDLLNTMGWSFENKQVNQLRDKITADHSSLSQYVNGKLFMGIKTGYNKAFIINEAMSNQLIAKNQLSEQFIYPFLVGEELRKWHSESDGMRIIFVPSGFTKSKYGLMNSSQTIEKFDVEFELISNHLGEYAEECEKRTDKGDYWWELRPCAYKDEFFKAKIVWPDIAKSNRFSMDLTNSILGNTAYFIPTEDYFLLGILNSDVTWFTLSGISIPFGERSGQFRYRLFRQYMERLPIPTPSDVDRRKISSLSHECSILSMDRFAMIRRFLHRLHESFRNELPAKPTLKLLDWPSLNFKLIGEEIKKSYKLKQSPWSKPQVAEDWESFWHPLASQVANKSHRIEQIESEMNDMVNFLFGLTQDEVRLISDQVQATPRESNQ